MQSTPTDGPLVVAIDSSTTATKAIVVDAAGNVLALGKRDIALLSPEQGFGEHDPRQWWTSTRDAIAEALAGLTPAEKERVAALGITHQRESFAPFTADGTPLRNGILWLDIRAADKVTTVSAYIAFCLTGSWVDSAACADSLSLSNIRTLDYDEGLLQIAGVRRDQMAGLVKPGQTLGALKPELAKEWGVAEIPVIAGCGDGQAAGVGAAAVTPDVAYLNMGTAVNAGVTSPEYQFGQVYRTLAGGIPDTYILEVLQSSGNYLATWFRRALGRPELAGAPDPELEALAAARTPGSGGLVTLPYWNAVQSPYWEPVARGAIVGWRGTHGKGSMYRSLLEAICIEMSRSLHAMEEATGVKLTAVRGMGGGLRSPLWRQIMTDAIGLPITGCKEEEISALGAAIVAMASTGVFGDTSIATAAERMAQFTDVTEPNMDEHEVYAELGEIQGRLYSNLKETNDLLHEFAKRHPDAELSGAEE